MEFQGSGVHVGRKIRSWGVLEPSWQRLGPSWEPPEASWGPPGLPGASQRRGKAADGRKVAQARASAQLCKFGILVWTRALHAWGLRSLRPNGSLSPIDLEAHGPSPIGLEVPPLGPPTEIHKAYFICVPEVGTSPGHETIIDQSC